MTIIRKTSERKDGGMGRVNELSQEERKRRFDFARHTFLAACNDQRRDEAMLLPVMAGQVHGVNIAFVDEKDAGTIIPDCDGLITTASNLPLMIGHQDCVPVFLWSKSENVIGILHAGWRGVVYGILKEAVEMLQAKEVTESASLFIHLGPAMQPCHFEVQKDVSEAFKKAGLEKAVVEDEQRVAIDMHAALIEQAMRLGIPAQNISTDSRCTFCASRHGDFTFPSWRRDGSASANAVSIIAKCDL